MTQDNTLQGVMVTQDTLQYITGGNGDTGQYITGVMVTQDTLQYITGGNGDTGQYITGGNGDTGHITIHYRR